MKREAIEILRRKASRDLLSFLQWCWWWPRETRPLAIGRHTRALCRRLTKAVDDWLDGRSIYLIINMPFRHGKSDLVSRALPAFFLGRAAAHQPDVIMSGYGTSLVKTFSRKVRSIIASDAYRLVFPDVKLSETSRAVEEWQIEGSQGTVTVAGLGGAITGKGGHLIIVDDYCKNREEAESKTLRDKTWDSFSDDLMTRANAPAAIVIVCATRWHTDDIVGRIYDAMKRDPSYPRFESLVFPARKPGKDGWDTLFPELYSADWYAAQRAQLGAYSAAALLDCNPVSDEMKVFKPEWLGYYDRAPRRETMNIYIFADGANAKKSQSDFTTMWVVGYGADENFYILDAVHDRLNLKERTEKIFALHRKWKPLCVFWEQVGIMADVAHIQDIQDREGYHFQIHPLSHTVAKDSRIRSLQPLFEAGRIWLPRAIPYLRADGTVSDVVREFVEDEYSTYPAVKHDDMLDPLADINDAPVRQLAAFPMAETPSDTSESRPWWWK